MIRCIKSDQSKKKIQKKIRSMIGLLVFHHPTASSKEKQREDNSRDATRRYDVDA
jgi:hypothetical protein